MKIRIISYDIQPLITKGIKHAAQKNINLDFIEAFDNINLFQDYIDKCENMDIIIIGLLSSEGSSLSLVYKIKNKYPDAFLIAYTVIESPFLIESLLSNGISKVIHKRVAASDMLNQSIQEFTEGQSKSESQKKKLT